MAKTSKATERQDYSIRLVRADEIALLPDIEMKAGALFADAGLQDVADNPPADLEYIESFRRAGAVHVAVSDRGEPVGFALSGLLDGAGHLYELSVDPAHGRRGLGARLVAASGNSAHARGVRAMTLSTFRDLAWNGPFYARLGFRELARNEWTPGLHLLHAREIDIKLPVERRCFMRKEL
ncbi:MAG: GNAT family N-acetyltransferase [Parvibaculum sp.]|uniref:GNAT family N-acetyltransferase n=1 Tax=Parvibaculum sp. TaxID=2024848 RepID=UPI0025E67DE4|nr:GNAT family N-acetyltransferase [Parvibaculum sp.]MCE9651433.1 GNAT family N-acetyltransferase [Parvibaculum sp.]